MFSLPACEGVRRADGGTQPAQLCAALIRRCAPPSPRKNGEKGVTLTARASALRRPSPSPARIARGRRSAHCCSSSAWRARLFLAAGEGGADLGLAACAAVTGMAAIRSRASLTSARALALSFFASAASASWIAFVAALRRSSWKVMSWSNSVSTAAVRASDLFDVEQHHLLELRVLERVGIVGGRLGVGLRDAPAGGGCPARAALPGRPATAGTRRRPPPPALFGALATMPTLAGHDGRHRWDRRTSPESPRPAPRRRRSR